MMRARSISMLVTAFVVGCDGAPAIDAGPFDAAVMTAPADAGAGAPDGGPQVPIDFFAYLADPYVTARALPGSMTLASSRSIEGVEGLENDDYGHFLRRDGSEAVLVDTNGPGVVTRIWFTLRERSSGSLEIADDTVMHLYVDGAEVQWGDAARGIRLGELGSGEVEGFPRPWVAGRDIASGAIQSTIPLQFQQSLRITLEDPPDTLVYYQIDLRRLPPNAVVRSFDGALTGEERAHLDRATALWVRRELEAAQTSANSATLEPGESLAFVVAEPTVLRRLWIETSSLPSLSSELVVDGESLIDGSIARWMFGAPPTEPSASALSVVAEDRLELLYPIPAREGATWTVQNDGAEPAEVALVIDHDPGEPDADLGRLRISCGAPQSPEDRSNFALLALSGVRGHYAGQFLVTRASMWGFTMLEGDHEVAVDGEYTILGTGVEDYFGGSFYYFSGPFALPMTGASGASDLSVDRAEASQYRHHLIDTIAFEESFRFEYETFAPGSTFAHCLYWYEE